MRILGVGIATLDIINTVSSYPAEDDEVRSLSRSQVRGGNVTNSLCALSKLGHACSWAGMRSDDQASSIVIEDLDKNRVDHELSIVDYGSELPVSYITLNAKNGSRTIVHYRNLAEYDSAHFLQLDLDKFDWIHFEGRNVEHLKIMFSHLIEHGYKRFSLEVEKPRKDLEDLFQFPALLLFSRAYVHESHESVKAFFSTLRQKQVGATLFCAWGKAGGWAMDADDQLYQQPAFEPEQVIDTLGAGDIFNAGVLHSWLEKANASDALAFACKAAGFKCGIKGFDGLEKVLEK